MRETQLPEEDEILYRTEPGSLLAGRYRIVGVIGKGGMGSVHLAEDIRLGGKLRAVKLTLSPSREKEKFFAEARMLGRLQHPHLPQIVDYYPPDREGRACIVMDYVAGETLAERWIQAGGRISCETLIRYLLQLTDVLRYLHAQEPPVVFRDLKPGNVLIDAKDRAILVDFGIARHYRPSAGSDTLMLGTPGFAAPEQLRGEQSDARTDLYGLGALAYYLLSGGTFASRRGASSSAQLPDAPPGFRDLLDRLLAERPEARPPSAEALYEELLELAEACGLPGSPGARHSAEGGNSGRGASIVAVVSAYPGAGASFLASALSARLAELEVPHALAECPGGDPELYAALDGDRRRPPRTAFADPTGELPSAPAWRSGTAAYYPLDPQSAGRRPPETGFASWLRRLGPPIVLLDVSSRWEEPAVADWVGRHADRVYMVADSLPVKWNERRQRALRRISEAAKRRGAGEAWIANRDHRFARRAEWLSGFPAKPRLALPCLPPEEVSAALWKGASVRPQGRTRERIDRFLREEWGS